MDPDEVRVKLHAEGLLSEPMGVSYPTLLAMKVGRGMVHIFQRNPRLVIDEVSRERLAARTDWRTCARCQREQEPEEFGRAGSYCRSCESERVSAAYHRRRQSAA